MAILVIQPQVKEGLNTIALLNEEQFNELLSAVNKIPSHIRQHVIFALRGFKFASIPTKESNRAQESLFSLYISRVDNDVSVSNYVNDIAESLKEERQTDKDWTLS